jgi:hypothetical protein
LTTNQAAPTAGPTLSELRETIVLRLRFGDIGEHRAEHWVLIDEHENVLWDVPWRALARARLNALFDEQPARALRLRLVLLREGHVRLVDWPRRGTPVERARALVRRFQLRCDVDPEQARALARGYYLRLQRASTRDDSAFMVAWYTEDAELAPTGLIYKEVGKDWRLLTDDAQRRLPEQEVLRRIAEAATMFAGRPVDATDVATAAARSGALRPDAATAFVMAVGVEVARRLGALRGDFGDIRWRWDD